MNLNHNPDDPNLGRVLRQARPETELPPRFQEGVWRRIAEAESPTRGGVSWLEALAALILRPRFAFATAAILVVAGGLLGARGGMEFARKDAQARYVAAVAPHALH